MVTEASLPQSRVATAGNGITITDAGAGSTGTIGVASTITGANVLTWDAGDTIFTNRRQMLLGSGLSAAYGTNTLTLSVTGQNAGTVTSVGLSSPSWLTVDSSPVTTAGTISLTATNQAANTLLMGPSGGADAASAFRKLLGVDLPISAGSNIVLSTDATGGLNIASTGGGGSGTVTSVGLTAPNIFAVTGSPVITSGTLDLALESQTQSTFLAAPSGGAGTPFFRIVTRNDLPITPGSNVTFSLNSSGGLAINASVSGGGGGTVTSVDSTTPTSLFTVSGNPITLSGTLAYALTPAACSLVWAGPVSGVDANPTYRALVAADLPVGVAINLQAGAGVSLTTTATSTTISVNGVTSTTTTPYAPASTDFIILVNSTGGAKVVDLPAVASNLGRILHIKKFDTSGNTVTINRNSTDMIDGATSYVLSASYQGVSLACDGTNWAVF